MASAAMHCLFRMAHSCWLSNDGDGTVSNRSRLNNTACREICRQTFQRLHDLAVNHDALDATLFALAKRALGRDAYLIDARLTRRRLDARHQVRHPRVEVWQHHRGIDCD